MPYKVKSFIEVEVENPTIFETEEEAKTEEDHCSHLQTENRYEVVECDEKGEEVE